MPEHETYEVFAVKYAERDARRPEHFLGGDPHDVPMPMDYFVWAIVGRGSTFVSTPGSTPSTLSPAIGASCARRPMVSR